MLYLDYTFLYSETVSSHDINRSYLLFSLFSWVPLQDDRFYDCFVVYTVRSNSAVIAS